MANILLINSVIREFALPNNVPLGVLYIASCLREAGHEVEVCDFNGLRVINPDREYWLNKYRCKYDIIGISGLIVTYHEQRRYVDYIQQFNKEFGSPIIILGGGLATSVPEFTAKHFPEVDILAIGEGEITMLELANGGVPIEKINGIAYREGKELVFTQSRELIHNLDTLPFPAWDLVPVEDVYIHNAIWGTGAGNSSKIAYEMQRSMNMINSRGCPYNCAFCISGDTLILMVNGKSKKMSEVQIGEKIIGVKQNEANDYFYCESEILNKWETEKPAIKITLENGNEVICSEDHRWLTDRDWKYTIGEMTGDNQRPYLTDNNYIRGIGYINETPDENDNYKKGYLSGLINGDGILQKYKSTNGISNVLYSRYSFRIFMKDYQPIERAKLYLDYFGIAYNQAEINTDYGIMYMIRKNAKSIVKQLKTLIQYQDNYDFYRGYLAGFYDAEGSLDKSTISMCNCNIDYINFAIKSLAFMGFEFTLKARKRNNENHKELFQLRIRGGISECLRFCQITNPSISRKNINISGFMVKKGSKIKSIEHLNKTEKMYDITTTTENFIANGIISHNCYHYVFGKQYRMRSVGNVISEIVRLKELYNIDFAGFVDDNTTANREWIYNFCKEMISADLNVKWGCSARVNQVDPYILALMKQAGCEFIGFGVESGNPSILKAMNKKIIPEQASKAIRMVREAGIWANATFIAGYPSETIETLRDTAKFMKANNCLNSIFYATPYPGTELYEESKAKIIAKYDTEDNYIMSLGDATEFRVNLSDMSDAELIDLRKKAMIGVEF